MTMARSLRRPPLPLLSLFTFAVVWQIVGSLDLSPALPPLSRVLDAMGGVITSEPFQEAAWNTALSVLIAFPCVVVGGVVIGVLMGTFRMAAWIFNPYVNLSLSLPLVSMIPIVLLIFGLGRASIIVVIILYALPVIIVNTAAGVRNVDADQLAMADSFGAQRQLVLRRVVGPSAARLIMAGIRIAAGRAIKGAIIAEQIVGLVGLGGLIQRLGGAFAAEDLYAVVLIIGLSGVVIVAGLGRLERRVTTP